MVIISQKLTKSNFNEFGDILSIENEINHTIINNGFTQKYNLSKFIGNKNNAYNKVAISIFRGLRRSNPLKINMLECHPLGSQSFMPLNGGKWVVIVCKGDSKEPNLKDLKCFIANKNQGVNYYPGTWHHPLITLEENQDFMVVDRKNGTDNNLIEFCFNDISVKL